MDKTNLKVGDRVRLDYSLVESPRVPHDFPTHMADYLSFHESKKGYLTIERVDMSGGGDTVYFMDVPPNDNGAWHGQVYIVDSILIKSVLTNMEDVDIYKEAGKRV